MQKLKAGDEIRVPPVRIEAPESRKVPEGLVDTVRSCILEQNQDFVILEKPAGLAMHGGTGLSYGLMDAIERIDPDWRPVHRLDRPTSGLLVLACKHQALVQLQRQFSQRQADKRYLALLEGALPEARVEVDRPLKKIRDGSGQRRIIVDPEGQSARSIFRLLEQVGRYSFVEVMIETGRTHQIRAHAAWLGHPIAGDELYNEATAPAGLDRLFLHAHYLRLSWPEDRIFSSPLPDELSQLLDRLRGRAPFPEES
jgi:23S rRNA pseudouridine955/2504/2580 synthase